MQLNDRNLSLYLPLQIMKTEHTYNVEEASFDDLVIAKSNDIPVFVDISAEWCAPCRVLGPLLHKMAGLIGIEMVMQILKAE